ncbi:MAG: TonB-dependent receptor [Pseudomonadota bacterium]
MNTFLKSSVCLAAFAAFSAHAQDTSEFDEPDEIVVTGTKLGLSVQDSPVSVEVFDQERLERESLFDLDDVLLRSPNVAINGNTNSLTIRGINRNGVSGGGQGVTSNIYIDGAPLATTAITFGLESVWDVSQIEVLRGPQSTVQGRNALAGAIVIVTADPTYDWQVKGRARYGSFNSQQYSGAISGPIIQDQLAFRVSADYQSTDGFIDNVNPTTGEELDQDFLEALTIRSKLLIEPEFLPDLRTELIFEYAQTELGIVSDFVAAPVPVTDPEFQNFDPVGGLSFGDFQFNETEILRGIADVSYDLSDNIELKWLGTFEEVSRDRVLGDPVNFTFDTNGFNDDVIQTYTTELSINFNYDRFSANIGGYYFNLDEDFAFNLLTPLTALAPPGIVINPPSTLLQANTVTDTNTENFAFYGQLRYDLTDRWTIGLGLRYDNESFDTTGLVADTSLDDPACTATLPGAIVGAPLPFVTIPCTTAVALFGGGDGQPPQPQSDTFSAFLPRASITHHFTDDISAFFAFQRGYRAGGTFVQQTATTNEVGQPVPITIQGVFDPEFINNFELGFRSQFLDRSLTLNGSLFYSVLDNQQVSLPGPTGSVLDFFTDNIGGTEIYGLEVSFDYKPRESLDFYGSLGLLDSEFTEFPFLNPDNPIPPRAGEPIADLAGNEPTLAPNVTFTIGGSYNHRSGLFVDTSFNFTGETESGVENLRVEDLLSSDVIIQSGQMPLDPALSTGLDEVSDTRSILNLRLGYRADNFTLAFFATNLLDDDGLLQRNFANVTPQTAGVNDPNGLAEGTPFTALNFFPNPTFTRQQPRIFGVQLDFDF